MWLCCSPWLFNFRLLTHIFSDITKWGNNRSLSGGQIMFIYRHHLSWWVIVPFILIRGTSSKPHERAHKWGLLLTLYKPLHRAHVLNNLHAHHNSCLFNVWPSIRPHLSVPHTHRLHRPGKRTQTHTYMCVTIRRNCHCQLVFGHRKLIKCGITLLLCIKKIFFWP